MLFDDQRSLKKCAFLEICVYISREDKSQSHGNIPRIINPEILLPFPSWKHLFSFQRVTSQGYSLSLPFPSITAVTLLYKISEFWLQGSSPIQHRGTRWNLVFIILPQSKEGFGSRITSVLMMSNNFSVPAHVENNVNT